MSKIEKIRCDYCSAEAEMEHGTLPRSWCALGASTWDTDVSIQYNGSRVITRKRFDFCCRKCLCLYLEALDV